MKKDKRKKEKFIDDGRVIAPMNVDGMPWYDRRKIKTGENYGENDESGEEERSDYASLSPEGKKAYRRETRRIIRGVLLYALPFVLAFVAVFAALIFFLTLVWK
ncbi:MAG: hypothetical protein J6Z34_06880 [Clostridia bacterium]|nr:hypothetical protein [Clostridia bacterium]